MKNVARLFAMECQKYEYVVKSGISFLCNMKYFQAFYKNYSAM